MDLPKRGRGSRGRRPGDNRNNEGRGRNNSQTRRDDIRRNGGERGCRGNQQRGVGRAGSMNDLTRNREFHRRHIGYQRLKELNEIDDVDDLLMQVKASQEALKQLLDYEVIKDDWSFQLLQIFAKISQARRSEIKVSVLAQLRGSQFITRHLGNSMLVWSITYTAMEKKEIAEWLVQLMEVYLKLFESSYHDMPLDSLITFGVNDIELQAKVERLLETRRELVKKSLEKKPTLQREKFVDLPPPEDFREIETIPNVNDIHRVEEPYLRPIKKKGGYDNGEHYLDVQFRLLREDLVAPLKGGIDEVINEVPRKNRKYGLKVYNGVQVKYPICTKSGLTYRICFDTGTTKGVPWKHSRRLIFGSLLCFSKDQFETMIFAIVADRDPKLLTDGLLSVRFVGDVENYFKHEEVMEMVESSAYFEAYKHVLEGMKECDPDNIPMHDYIVHCKLEVDSPLFLRIHDPRYDLSSALSTQMDVGREVQILNDKSWPPWQETELNESQLKAFKHALTKEFVVIQGPPGTGKTHVGLRIAHAMLENKEYWNANGRQPMLVVCYTNHALDQFLNGLIQFGHQSILRVGGRAHEDMQKYSLQFALNKLKEGGRQRHQTDEFKHLRRAKAAALEDRDNYIQSIEGFTEQMVESSQKLLKGKLVHFATLQRYMKEEHVEYLGAYDALCRPLKMSIFDVYLGLCPVDLEDLFDMELIDTSLQSKQSTTAEQVNNHADGEEVKAGIDVDGEGEVLVDRWAADTNEFQEIGKRRRKNMRQEKQKPVRILQSKDGFQYVQKKPFEKRIQIQKSMRENGIMTAEEVERVFNPWNLTLPDRWRLYRYWVHALSDKVNEEIRDQVQTFETVCTQIKEIQQQEDKIAICKADVVAMTTTCAARYQTILEQIKPKVVIIEEAAEVLEAHVLTSLSTGLEHLILIGDHQQLKPSPEVFDLAIKYNLELSLFQRMVNNGMECHTLEIQHRMRPQISKLLRNIYPMLKDHPTVRNYPDIKGVSKNLMFINHHEKEFSMEHTKSKANVHEAYFIKGLCFYFLQQGYKAGQITILTGYAGQLIQLKNIMPRSVFEGVRVTAVDNFQGEENDIILLSLVRSNVDGNIGFLKIDNRICVSMSRAKHGLFVIGNFDLMQQKSLLWKNIISDAKRMGCFDDHIQLHCQNHPYNTVYAKTDKDFLSSPEGGCTKPCEFRLNCGHVCEKACHPKDPQHLEYKCKKNCNRSTCDLEHRCKKQCHYGKECGPCTTLKTKTLLCWHTQSVPCSTEVSKVECLSKCEKKLQCGHPCKEICSKNCKTFNCDTLVEKKLPCDHVQNIPCFKDVALANCRIKCTEELDCGHTCTGTCGICKRSRLHKKCASKCERVLVCSHLCEEPCTRNCPPCLKPCENRCYHSKCEQVCGKQCTPCMEKCMWQCHHKKCTRRCSETCDREPCDLPCRKRLSCEHKCIGLCGEVCPTLCRVCHQDKVQEIFFGDEDEPDARFIVLEDCKHFFEVKALDKYMHGGNGNENLVKLKECPRCKTIIRKSVRYGNIVKSTLKDINEIKRNILEGDKSNLEEVKQMAFNKCKEINEIIEGIAPHALYFVFHGENVCTFLGESTTPHNFSKALRDNVIIGKLNNAAVLAERLSKTMGIVAANGALYQAKLLEALWKLRKEVHESPKVEDSVIKSQEILDLDSFIMTERISEQQLREASEDLERNRLHVNVQSVFYDLKNKVTDIFGRMESANLKKHMIELKGGKKVSKERLAEIAKLLAGIQRKYNLKGISNEDKLMIIRAMGLGKGHWYKCPNGHFYAIGECGGATQRSKCPDCGSAIGGSGHALAAGNQHAGEFDSSRFAAYSEEANNPLNWDPEMLRQLRL